MMNNYIYTPSCSYICYFCFVLFKLQLQIFILGLDIFGGTQTPTNCLSLLSIFNSSSYREIKGNICQCCPGYSLIITMVRFHNRN